MVFVSTSSDVFKRHGLSQILFLSLLSTVTKSLHLFFGQTQVSPFAMSLSFTLSLRDGIPEGYIQGFVCTLATCDVTKWGFVKYQPSLPGNSLFLAIFLLIIALQVYLGIKYHTAAITFAMVCGGISEVIGYLSRILLHGNPFYQPYFLVYLINLTIAPVFFSAAIYLCLGRIVVIFGEEISRVKPRWYTWIFLTCDFLSLVVQAVGGGIAASVPLTNQKAVCIVLLFCWLSGTCEGFDARRTNLLTDSKWNTHIGCRFGFPSCEFSWILGTWSRVSLKSL